MISYRFSFFWTFSLSLTLGKHCFNFLPFKKREKGGGIQLSLQIEFSVKETLHRKVPTVVVK